MPEKWQLQFPHANMLNNQLLSVFPLMQMRRDEDVCIGGDNICCAFQTLSQPHLYMTAATIEISNNYFVTKN